MLHVTTEIGKVGKKERERRHYSFIYNTPLEPVHEPRGRRYIPHNYGTDIDWVPHNQYMEPQLTESGPDWSSRLRYIPDPENPDYPAAEIWPNNWRSMRPFPYCKLDDNCGEDIVVSDQNDNSNNNNNENDDVDLHFKTRCGYHANLAGEKPLIVVPKNTIGDLLLGASEAYKCKPPYEWLEEMTSEMVYDTYKFGDRGKRKGIWTYQRTDKEWLLDPGLSTRMRCVFNGQHKASATSDAEITHTMVFGKGRPESMVDKRNGMSEASPGDKNYQVPEYSPSFHKLGSTRPLIRYGPARSLRMPDTFIPLTPITTKHRESFRQKEKTRQNQVHVEEVKKLELWKPATPLPLTIPVLDKEDEEAFAKLNKKTKKK